MTSRPSYPWRSSRPSRAPVVGGSATHREPTAADGPPGQSRRPDARRGPAHPGLRPGALRRRHLAAAPARRGADCPAAAARRWTDTGHRLVTPYPYEPPRPQSRPQGVNIKRQGRGFTLRVVLMHERKQEARGRPVLSHRHTGDQHPIIFAQPLEESAILNEEQSTSRVAAV